MTESLSTRDGGFAPSERRYFLNIALGYWREEKAKQAWLLTGAIGLLVLLTLGVQLGINYWNRLFYDALDRRDGAALLHGVFVALGLVAAAAAVAVCLVHARMRLQIKWRGWLTKRLIGYWLADRRFYQMSVVENEGSNPEFRITDDTRLATEPIVDFAIGLTTAVLTAAAFVGILVRRRHHHHSCRGRNFNSRLHGFRCAGVLGTSLGVDLYHQPEAGRARRREERRRPSSDTS